MEGCGRSYRVVCFDLDGTLLPMDIDEFMGAYFKRIAAFAASCGLDAGQFMSALKAGTKAMAAHSADVLNKDAFWEVFAREYPESMPQAESIADEFYDADFPHIGDGFAANPDAARAVRMLKAKGYPLVLTTTPMFPRRAVEHRLSWAGLDASDFSRITSYENSASVKPMQTYYAENLAAMGVGGEDVLMVGNNTMEDLSFMDLGADAYLVTDWLLDPVGYDIDKVKHGSFADFCEWVESLPECSNPAGNMQTGPVDASAAQAALDANACEGLDLGAARRNAAAVAEAVSGEHEAGRAGSLKGFTG